MANKKITDLMSGTPTRDSLLESATDVGGTMVSRKFKVGAVADVNNIQIASEYDDTATYAYGAYCIYDGMLYRCTTAISVAEAWTVAHWTAVMVTGEYKRVRIMTKAQFDLLSNDEKDGFIYISDYPTKIQDIDNVSLTTSDNNKLLGVSVVGSDISVGAVTANNIASNITVNSSYATLVATYIDGGGISYSRYGRLVVVDFNARFKANTPTDTIVASNLPTSTGIMHFLIGQGGNVYRGYLESGGTIKFSDVPPSGYCTGMFVYVVSV